MYTQQYTPENKKLHEDMEKREKQLAKGGEANGRQ
jgi:hypothetical protein